jgi:hypothetical protein
MILRKPFESENGQERGMLEVRLIRGNGRDNFQIEVRTVSEEAVQPVSHAFQVMDALSYLVLSANILTDESVGMDELCPESAIGALAKVLASKERSVYKLMLSECGVHPLSMKPLLLTEAMEGYRLGKDRAELGWYLFGGLGNYNLKGDYVPYFNEGAVEGNYFDIEVTLILTSHL